MRTLGGGAEGTAEEEERMNTDDLMEDWEEYQGNTQGKSWRAEIRGWHASVYASPGVSRKQTVYWWSAEKEDCDARFEAQGCKGHDTPESAAEEAEFELKYF